VASPLSSLLLYRNAKKISGRYIERLTDILSNDIIGNESDRIHTARLKIPAKNRPVDFQSVNRSEKSLFSYRRVEYSTIAAKPGESSIK